MAEQELLRCGEFVLPGVAKLVVQQREKRMGRNPRTGARIEIPAKQVVKTHIAKQLQDVFEAQDCRDASRLHHEAGASALKGALGGAGALPRPVPSAGRADAGRGGPVGRTYCFERGIAFCMFADDVGLLPDHIFTRMPRHARPAPERSSELAGDLFEVMATGGRVGFETVAWFNGGLADDNMTLPLEKSDVQTVLATSNLDWSEMDRRSSEHCSSAASDPAKRAPARCALHGTGQIMRRRVGIRRGPREHGADNEVNGSSAIRPIGRRRPPRLHETDLVLVDWLM